MFLAKMSIKRPVMTTVIIMVFLIFGFIAYLTINLNLFPDIEIPYITISTIYPGAGPKEVETLITKRLEEVVSTISMIERVESYSLDGVSIIIIEFKFGKDVNVANQEVKDKVDEILYKLPEDSKKPIIQKIDLKAFPVLDMVLTGPLEPKALYEIADKSLKDRFSQVAGVAKVNISGGQEREVQVRLDNRIAFENSVSLPQLLQVLKAYNMDIPGGYFSIGNQEYTVRLKGEFPSIEAIKELVIPTTSGNKKIGQFATVTDSGKDIRQRTIYYDAKSGKRNENVVKISVIKSSEGNVIKVVDAIKGSLSEIESTLPAGCKLEVLRDQSDFTKSSVDDTVGNIVLGIIFTAIVLLLFLYDVRSTFIIALSMPISIISTFMLLKMFGLTLNMMTLMGLSVSIGVLVANSIVVIENIFRHKDMGKSIKTASYTGTTEIVVAVLASTLTNLVVFLPLANMSSIVGEYLKELALAATFATLFSLFFSFTLTPMLTSLIIPNKRKTGKISSWFMKVEKYMERIYSSSLAFVLKKKLISVLFIISVFFVFIFTMGFFGSKLGFEFMPLSDEGFIKLEVELPDGYNLEESKKYIYEIEDRLKKHKEVKFIVSDLGRKSDLDVGSNLASIDVQLVNVKERTIGIQDMISIFIKELSDIPNAKIKVENGSGMGDGGAPIQFYLLGQELDTLEKYKTIIYDKIKTIPGLVNFDQSSRAGKPEITVTPKREVITEAGLTVMDLAYTLRASIEGIVSSKYREHGNEYDILVSLLDKSVDSPEKIGDITVVSPYGGTYRMSQLADIGFTTGYTKILHRDKYTTIMFTGSNAANVPMGNVTSEIDKRLAEIKLPQGYSVKWGGNTKMMNEMMMDMVFAFFLAIVLTYLLLAAMLESFLQPFFILSTIPLALIGVIILMYYTDVSFGITSLMGIIMLIGIVVNNAILQLDYANQLRREEGKLPKEAILEACPIKLKPIIMSTLALILGMLPMALGIGDSGKEMRIPLGISSVGGLAASTVLTLYFVPALYYVFSRSKRKAKKTDEEEEILLSPTID